MEPDRVAGVYHIPVADSADSDIEPEGVQRPVRAAYVGRAAENCPNPLGLRGEHQPRQPVQARHHLRPPRASTA